MRAVDSQGDPPRPGDQKRRKLQRPIAGQILYLIYATKPSSVPVVAQIFKSEPLLFLSYSANKDMSESPLLMRLNVSACSAAQDNCRILLHALAAGDSGFVSSSTRSSRDELDMRSIAEPDYTGWVQ